MKPEACLFAGYLFTVLCYFHNLLNIGDDEQEKKRLKERLTVNLPAFRKATELLDIKISQGYDYAPLRPRKQIQALVDELGLTKACK